MRKAEKSSRFGSESRLTRVQEFKQDLGLSATLCFQDYHHFHISGFQMILSFCDCVIKTKRIVQQPCQHLGGINLVDRVMESLLSTSGGSGDPYTAMIDLVGYDAWPSTYCLHQAAAGWLFDQTCWSKLLIQLDQLVDCF